MSRYRRYSPGDDPIGIDGDTGFIGVNMKQNPANLKEGYDPNAGPIKSGLVSLAVNKRFNRGVAATRPGIFAPTFANVEFFGEIFGSTVFSDPDDLERLLVAVQDGVWAIREGYYPTKIELPEGEEIDAPVELHQAFERVIMFRGFDRTPLEWDGDLSSSFVEITQGAPVGGFNQPIPNSDHALMFVNRSFVKVSRDRIAVSGILDPTNYDPILDEFNINPGSDDEIVRFMGYTPDSIIVFNDQSIYLISGVSGDLSNVSQEVINNKLGCAAKKSCVQVGADILFLSRGGVYRLGQVIEQKLETSPTPVSDSIEPLIKRINQRSIHLSVGTLDGDYYKLAVPLDDSEEVNALLVYNTISGEWEGYDQYHSEIDMDLLGFHHTDYSEKRRLFGVLNRRDSGNGAVVIMDEGQEDIIGEERHPVVDILRTRAYAFFNNDIKEAYRVTIWINTWNPFLSVLAVPLGFNEQTLIAPAITKDRAKYYGFGKVDFDTTNINGDFNVKGRQDYSVRLGEEFYLSPGLKLHEKQSCVERHLINLNAEALAIEIVGSQGVSEIVRIQVECLGSEAARDSKTKI